MTKTLIKMHKYDRVKIDTIVRDHKGGGLKSPPPHPDR